MDVDDSLRSKLEKDLFTERLFFTYLKLVHEINNLNVQNKVYKEKIRFNVLQLIGDSQKKKRMMLKIASFYNNNFCGNKDFIHIPSFTEITENSNFPVLIATRTNGAGRSEIIGVTTIKVEKNDKYSANPYFPTINQYVISVNGILTKLDLADNDGNRIKGIGKELFKIAICGACEINKYIPTRFMCKIDCRNINSIYSISNAVREAKKFNPDCKLNIDGYYELKSFEQELLEAPTFIAEVKFDCSNKIGRENVQISFEDCCYGDLYNNIAKVIKMNTCDVEVCVNNYEEKAIVFHRIKPIDLLSLKINVGTSALGNERTNIVSNKEVVSAII